MPKSLFLFLGFLVLSSTGLSAQQSGQSKHSPIITVQGHPHDGLTKLYGGKPYTKPAPKPKLGEIDPGDIECWTGHVADSLPVDTAYLLIKWTDAKRPNDDSLLVWGYRWNTISIYVYPSGERDTTYITVHTIDMVRAVANSDCRLLVLLQQTGVNGYAIGGIGYNYNDATPCKNCQRPPIRFDLAGAKADTAHIKFKYDSLPNCDRGQTAVPFLPDSQAIWAIRAATPDSLVYATAIIEHPFNVNYGYPAYDYDYWLLNSVSTQYRWQAGWYSGSWLFYTGVDRQIPTTSSYDGITTHALANNDVNGFVFALPVWPPVADFSGQPFYVTCPCNSCPTPSSRARKSIKP
jgi:hypothetical protein